VPDALRPHGEDDVWAIGNWIDEEKTGGVADSGDVESVGPPAARPGRHARLRGSTGKRLPQRPIDYPNQLWICHWSNPGV